MHSYPDYAERLIIELGIGSRRVSSAHPQTLFSNDYARERMRQEIRSKVRESKTLLEKRVAEVLNLEGMSLVVGENGSSRTIQLDFDTIYSGLDSEGKPFVSANESNLEGTATLLFMARKANDWNTETISKPNFETSYFRKLAGEEHRLSDEERSSLVGKAGES